MSFYPHQEIDICFIRHQLSKKTHSKNKKVFFLGGSLSGLEDGVIVFLFYARKSTNYTTAGLK